MMGGPQRMNANWKVVETRCLTCHGPFTFGEDVCMCNQCGGYHHARCWDSSGLCTHQGGIGPPRRDTVIEGSQPMPMPPPPPLPTHSYGPPPLPPQLPYGPQAPAYSVQQPYANMYGGAGYPGAASGLAQADMASRASSARTCGLISLITIVTTNVFSYLAVTSQSEELLRLFVRIRFVFSVIGIAVLVLAIVAVVQGSGAKRLMNRFPVDPRLRSKATAGQVMGWITLGIAVLGIVMFAIRGGIRGLG
jgi:hypothetical protein